MHASAPSSKSAYEAVITAVADFESLIGSPVSEWSGPDDGSDAFQLLFENDLEIGGDLIGDRVNVHIAVVAEWSKGTSRSILTIEDRRIAKDRLPDDLPGFLTPEDALASAREMAREAVVAAKACIAALADHEAIKKPSLALVEATKAIAVAHVGPGTSGVVLETTWPSRWSPPTVSMTGQDGPIDLAEPEVLLLESLLPEAIHSSPFGNPPVMRIEPYVLVNDVRDLPSPVQAARMLRKLMSVGVDKVPTSERKEDQ